MKFIYDCFMLLHSRYSGISNVTFALLDYFLSKKADCIYSIGYRILDDYEIEKFIENRSGINSIFDVAMHGFKKNQRFISQRDLNSRLYFSPHTFSCANVDALASVRMIHDLTPIIFPQFHTDDVNLQETMNLLEDIRQADHLITISEASKQHMEKYLGVAGEKISICAPGITWTMAQIANSSISLFDFPYVLAMGTLEPRKNLSLLFEYLLQNIDSILNDETIYVIAGQQGWGNVLDQNTKASLSPLLETNKLLFTGYIADEYKMALLAGAKYLIYPSFCEGFGLPVLEALSVGTPVACSYGGSLPEAGGNAAFYFSPFDIASMENAIIRLKREIDAYPETLRARCIAHAKKSASILFCEKIYALLSNVYARNAG